MKKLSWSVIYEKAACVQCHITHFRNLLYDFKKPIEMCLPVEQKPHSHDCSEQPTSSLLLYSRYPQATTNIASNNDNSTTSFQSNLNFRALLSSQNTKKRKVYTVNYDSNYVLLVLISLLTLFPQLTRQATYLEASLQKNQKESAAVDGSSINRLQPPSRRPLDSEQAYLLTVETGRANECLDSTLNKCQHHCHDTSDWFTCYCYPGFALTVDAFSCEPNENLTVLISSDNKIYEATFGSNYSHGPESTKILFEADSKIVAFAVDASKREIYYLEKTAGLWVYNTESKSKYLKKEDKNNSIIANAKLAYNWAENSLLVGIDLRILKMKQLAWDASFYISNSEQQIGDFAIDPIRNLLFVTELGAQSKLSILELDSKRKLYDFNTPTNNYLQSKMRVSTNIYNSKIYLVNQAGSLYSCFINFNSKLTCTVELVQGNITSPVLQYGSSLFYLSKNNSLTICNAHNCSREQLMFKLEFEPEEIAIWSKSSQLDLYDLDCRKCAQQCEVIDKWHVQCKCETGYELAPDTRSCYDIDECKRDPRICEEKCVNTLGGYFCTCESPITRIASDGRTCTKFRISCDQNMCSHGCKQMNNTSPPSSTMIHLDSMEQHQITSDECTCPVGSHLKLDQLTCTGCRAGDNGDCSHGCQDTGLRSFVCYCPLGFKLRYDQKTCYLDESELRIIGATSQQIRVFSLPNLQIVNTFNFKGIVSMVLDQEHRCIYYISSFTQSIGKINLTDDSNTKLLSTDGYKFTSIAIDWSYNTLYISDSATGSIYSFSLDKHPLQSSKGTLELILGDLTKPRDLTIDSDTGDLFFISEASFYASDGENRTRTELMRLSLTYNSLEILLFTLNETTSLTVDYISQRLFFSNLYRGAIESIDINPQSMNKTRSIQTLNSNAFKDSLQIVGDAIYTLDQDRRWKIVIFSKSTGKKLDNLSKNKRTDIGNLQHMIIFHQTQPINDRRLSFGPCVQNNGDCHHICRNTLEKAECSCFENFTLKQDGKTCEPIADPSEDYQLFEVVPLQRCKDDGFHCNELAQCIERNSNGRRVCKCQEGFYGDGVSSCRDVALKCTAEDVQKADCGRHGHCYKKSTFGNNFQLSCACESSWIGAKCWEFAGKRRRLWSTKPTVPIITTLQIVQISFMATAGTLFLTVFLGLLIFRRKMRNTQLQNKRVRQMIRNNVSANEEVIQQIVPRSLVSYTEVDCTSPTNDYQSEELSGSNNELSVTNFLDWSESNHRRPKQTCAQELEKKSNITTLQFDAPAATVRRSITFDFDSMKTLHNDTSHDSDYLPCSSPPMSTNPNVVYNSKSLHQPCNTSNRAIIHNPANFQNELLKS